MAWEYVVWSGGLLGLAVVAVVGIGRYRGCTSYYQSRPTPTQQQPSARRPGWRPAASPQDTTQLLHDWESLLAAIFKTAHVGICLTDRQGYFVVVNGAYAELHGYTEEELIGRDFTGLMPEPERNAALENHRAVIDDGHNARTERQALCRDGSYRDVLVSTAPLTLADGSRFQISTVVDISQHKQTERALLDESRQQLAEAQAVAQLGNWRLTAGGERISGSQELRRILGWEDEIQPTLATLLAQVHDEDRLTVEAGLQTCLVLGRRCQREFRFTTSEGYARYLYLIGQPQWDDDHVIVGAYGIVQDISLRKRAETALHASESRFRAFTENAIDMILVLDGDGQIRYASPSVERTLGYAANGLFGTPIYQLLVPEQQSSARYFLEQWLLEGLDTISQEWQLCDVHGEGHTIALVARNCLNIPGVDGIIINARDITAEKAARERIHYLAHHDGLTNLPNRVLLQSQARTAIVRARRHGGGLGFLFLDLDRFKPVNDSLGHAVGDELLKIIAERLRNTVRDNDLVARLGGDEFAVLLDGIQDPSDAAQVAEKLIATVEQPVHLAEQELIVSASIGISCYPEDGNDLEVLMQRADIAMYQVKQDGRSNYRLFTQSLHDASVARLLSTHQLRRDLSADRLSLQFLEWVDLHQGQVMATEAQLQWQHPEQGLLTGPSLDTLARSAGCTEGMAQWGLTQVCHRLTDSRGSAAALPLMVTITPGQLNRGDLLDQLRVCLADRAAARVALVLKLPFRALSRSLEGHPQLLDELHALGIAVMLVGFCASDGNIASLRHPALQGIQLESRHLAALSLEGDAQAIVSATVAIARQFGLDVGVDGIASQQQAVYFRELGCRWGQGEYFNDLTD